MSLILNKIAVPEELRDSVEEIAQARFPGRPVEWQDGPPGAIVLEIPEGNYGSRHDVDQNGRLVGEVEDGGLAVIATLQATLAKHVREKTRH